MADKAVIADAGFLVALFSESDANHRWAAAEARLNPPPWMTCESVLSEADHLLKPYGCAQLRAACKRGALLIKGMDQSGLIHVIGLMDKYADTRMSIADACVVWLSELQEQVLVLTVDSDFRIYRRFGRRVIPLRTP